MRRGLETLSITDARWKDLGLPDFAAPIHLSCSDHNGHHGIYLVMIVCRPPARGSGQKAT
jgi:branched-chain amino acid transport system substrate-binding protein